MTSLPTVPLVREFQRIHISPPCAEVLESLSTWRLVVRDEEDGGRGVGRVAEPLWDRHIEFRDPSCLAGLERALKSLMVGPEFSVPLECKSNTSPEQLPELDLEVVQAAVPIDRSIPEFVRDRERGMIACDKLKVDPVTLVAEIAEVDPGAAIAVVGTRLDDIRPNGPEVASYSTHSAGPPSSTEDAGPASPRDQTIRS